MVARRVRLVDVARAAHVSVSTASMALAGRPGVSERTRERVRRAAQELGYRADPAAYALRSDVGPVIAVLMDPLLREGAAVASGSYVGRLVNGLLAAAVRRGATALPVSPLQPPPAADSWLVLETGTRLRAPASRGYGVPVVCAGVPWPGWDREAAVTLQYPFAEAAAAVLNQLVAAGCRAPAICRPHGEATWLQELGSAYDLWCVRRGQRPIVGWYEPDPDSATAAGRDVVARGADGLFHISNRLQPYVVAGARGERPQLPVVVLGEGINEAAYHPSVGVLSLMPDETSELLIETALAVLSGAAARRDCPLPWRFVPGEA